MWHDNETTRDLIGFQRFADAIASLSTDETVLPVTIGVFGDWGSGKSSVLGMVEHQLSQEESVVTLRFDGWLFEGYDDAKAALMTSILDRLTDHIKGDEDLWAKVKTTAESLLKRINWFRAAGLAARGILTLTSPAGAAVLAGLTTADALAFLGQMAEDPEKFKDVAGSLIKQESQEESAVGQGMHESIRDFRSDFLRLMKDAQLGTLVVLIDDLDRCLPESIVSTLEAIKLFLSVSGTAFVIAADERIVRQAIAHRYPREQYQELDIAQEYLDKLVQIPCVIPPMDQVETETFVYLLFAERALEPPAFEKLCGTVDDNRRNPSLLQPLNFGLAQTCLGDDAAGLEHDFALAQRIAPILARQLGGNPRLVKRFLNTFALRVRLGETEGIQLDHGALAKLMVLERFHKDQFQCLHTWQAQQDGVPEQVPLLESTAGEAEPKPPGIDEATGALWLGDPDVREWLQMEPGFSGRNLAPYFHLARASLAVKVAGVRRLSQEQQELFANLQSGSAAARKTAAQRLAGKHEDEVYAVYDALWARVEQNPKGSEALEGLIELAYVHEGAARRLVLSVREVSPVNIEGRFVALFAGIAQHHASLDGDVGGQLVRWATSSHRPVAGAAGSLLEAKGES